MYVGENLDLRYEGMVSGILHVDCARNNHIELLMVLREKMKHFFPRRMVQADYGSVSKSLCLLSV